MKIFIWVGGSNLICVLEVVGGSIVWVVCIEYVYCLGSMGVFCVR